MKFLSVALASTALGAAKTPHPKVIGGRTVAISEAPFMAVIMHCSDSADVNTCFQMCSGSIIAPNVVLTAGHCVRDMFVQWANSETSISVNNLKVLLGSSNWMTWDDSYKAVNVASLSFSTFGMNIRFPMDGDIALLELAECVAEAPGTIEYAKVATWETEPDRSSGCSTVSVAGFGMVSNVPYPLNQDDGKLRVIVDNLHTPEVCREAYTALAQGRDTPDMNDETYNTAAVLGDNYICTGGVSWHTVCYGDSGGPTFTQLENGKYQVIGVTSFGFGNNYCTIGPDFATRVAFYADWIQEQLDTRFAKCSGWWVNATFAVNPPSPLPGSELSALWNSTRCNPSADFSETKWQCLSGQCIDKSNVCDGTDTCSDMSDESYVDSYSMLNLCPSSAGRRLLETPARKDRSVIKAIGGRKISSYFPEVKTNVVCATALAGVNSAIDSTSSQYTIGDLYWDPAAVLEACSVFVNCVADGTSASDSYEHAQDFCTALDNYMSSAAEALRWEQSFGQRFQASCANDEWIDSQTDAPPDGWEGGDHRSFDNTGVIVGVLMGILTLVLAV